MKNAILSFAIALLLLNGAASAQIVTQNGKDTAMAQYSAPGDLSVVNLIKSGSANNVVLKWNVIPSALRFDAGWTSGGVCDNITCYAGSYINTGVVMTSNPYDNSGFPVGSGLGTPHDFHAIFTVAASAADGSMGVVRVNAKDTVTNTTRTLTFIGYKGSLGVSTFSSFDDVVLFPNPARDAVNVIYDEKANVKIIAVYNLIGKLMGPIYRPSSAGSAKIDLQDMPTGIYFLRLMDGQGHVLSTRRFTRQ